MPQVCNGPRISLGGPLTGLPLGDGGDWPFCCKQNIRVALINKGTLALLWLYLSLYALYLANTNEMRHDWK